jgi:hypothetical protein
MVGGSASKVFRTHVWMAVFLQRSSICIVHSPVARLVMLILTVVRLILRHIAPSLVAHLVVRVREV